MAGEAEAKAASTEEQRYAQVALKLPLRREFTYRVPAGMPAQVGCRVRVPFRGRVLPGVVTELNTSCEVAAEKLRDLEKVLDGDQLMPEAVLQLAKRMAQDYGCSLGEALDATLPAATKRSAARRIPHVELNIPIEIARQTIEELEEKAQPRARVLRRLLEFGAPMPIMQLRQQTGTSDSPWKTLVKQGMLKRLSVLEKSEPLVPDAAEAAERHNLNEEQSKAVDRVGEFLDAKEHRVFLLHGVTGSGKTEVYLRILEKVREMGRSGIVLVPEISLTPQTVGRFASRFPDVAVLHSGLTEAERGRQWRRLQRGEAKIAIGARSALFAPLENVGLIVLDEEQETSFKQESTPRYHAREMAIARGEIEGACVVLGSATPTLESYGRAKRGVYEMLSLHSRAGLGTLPRVLVEDLRSEGKDSRVGGMIFSRTLRQMMEERLSTRDQIILFLNRRGYSPVLICPACGEVKKCRRCAISMTWHARRSRLICHYCCEEERRPELCGHCEHERMHELGSGTERVETAVKQLFPTAIVARMDADTMAERGAHERVLSAFRKRHIDVLIGTQMIAKGLDFPDVTLVGVISADTGLFFPDFRAAERSFQLLYQVAGRAGRAGKPGTVVIQTLCPDNYAVQAAAALDYESFVQQELQFRRLTGYPPYSRLVRILCESRREPEAKNAAAKIRQGMPSNADFEVLGPAPAALSKIKDRYRVHLLLKCRTPDSFRAAMKHLAAIEDRSNRNLRVVLDVDPTSLL